MIKKYVLAGGGCSGKTAIIGELRKAGYACIGEVAREVLKERNGFEETRDELRIRQKEIFKRQLMLEENLKPNNYFLDRSLVDGHAFCNFFGVPILEFLHFDMTNRYEKVFFLEQLPEISLIGRMEKTVEDARKIHGMILKSYEKFGYNPIYVPVMPLEERMDFILEKI